jgi:hypothetical protein
MSAKRHHKRWWIAAILVIGYLAALFIPFVEPYARYPIYFVKCGGQPIVGNDFASAYTYRTPSSPGYRVYPLGTRYFCTEAGAQAAGFHEANS